MSRRRFHWHGATVPAWGAGPLAAAPTSPLRLVLGMTPSLLKGRASWPRLPLKSLDSPWRQDVENLPLGGLRGLFSLNRPEPLDQPTGPTVTARPSEDGAP